MRGPSLLTFVSIKPLDFVTRGHSVLKFGRMKPMDCVTRGHGVLTFGRVKPPDFVTSNQGDFLSFVSMKPLNLFTRTKDHFFFLNICKNETNECC